ncbi:MAG: NADH-quinone oxidoreductase subunit N [Candidatus Abyssobacteria bacterium SURF_5]|uniref:NADH-quinone oxidoreductase subunit N n=1 Tax=Abyssobacteria bacterium (strain SURF_5) TaxID=2093360 RepID=A0A3A4NG20_ABYX5|nr:MAG: NADH-quinone oxidoreductase subunit N [Candidatus Abyssubacteria bacterium SURF_5]
MQLPAIDISAIAPEVVIALTGLLILAADIFLKPRRAMSLAVLALAGLFISLLMTGAIWSRDETAFSGMVAVDTYSQFFKIIFILSAAFTVLMSPRYLKLFNISMGEYLELILFATLGMMVMVAGNDLLTIYIGLELMAISIYLMAGFQRQSPRSSEASIKYFLLGSFASAILLYGISFFYGITSTTSLPGIAEYLDFTKSAESGKQITQMLNPSLITLSLVLMTVGFSFKIAAVPFHMWTPDVYEGAPTPLTAFMSVGPKVAGFAVIMRVYLTTFNTLVLDWTQLFMLLSILTMIVGNVVAVAQSNIKRMLAYSSIAHAGYLLIGVVSAGSAMEVTSRITLRGALISESIISVMVYLFAYMFMNLGTFAIVITLAREGDPHESLSDYAGLAKRRPLTAMLMAILLLSLAGIPPTFGFVGKLFIFKAAIDTENTQLAVIGVINSVIAAFYYIRVIVYMYMKESEAGAVAEGDMAGSTMYAAVTASLFTIVFGVAPGTVIGLARDTIAPMLQRILG